MISTEFRGHVKGAAAARPCLLLIKEFPPSPHGSFVCYVCEFFVLEHQYVAAFFFSVSERSPLVCLPGKQGERRNYRFKACPGKGGVPHD